LVKKYFFVFMAILVLDVQTAEVEGLTFQLREIDKDRISRMHFISTEPVKPLGRGRQFLNYLKTKFTPSPVVEGQGLKSPSLLQVPIKQNSVSTLTPQEIQKLQTEGASALFDSSRVYRNIDLDPELVFKNVKTNKGFDLFDYKNGRQPRVGHSLLIDDLAELLFYNKEEVRVEAKSYLEASKDAYPDQVNRILNLYNEFLLLEKQIDDILNNPTHTNSKDDNEQVSKEILSFIQKVRYERLDQKFKQMIISRVFPKIADLELVKQGKWTIVAPEPIAPDPVIKKPKSDFSVALLKDSSFPDMDIHIFQTLNDQQKQDLKNSYLMMIIILNWR